MNNNNKALDILTDKINYVVEQYTQKLKYDKTFKSTIWKINENGTYQICYLGQKYNIHNALGITLSLGQGVWVKIPNGTFRDMHICGVVK